MWLGCLLAVGELTIFAALPYFDAESLHKSALVDAAKCGNFDELRRGLGLLCADDEAVATVPSLALAAAAGHGHLRIVNYLLSGERAEWSYDIGAALVAAARRGHAEVVDRLLRQAGESFSPGTDAAIFHAASAGHVPVLQRLLSDERLDPTAGCDSLGLRVQLQPPCTENAALRSAADNGHAAAVECLLDDERVDAGGDDNFAICWAAETGNAGLVTRLLADPCVDASARGNYAIWVASRGGHASIVDLLLRQPGVDPAADGNAAIKAAVQGRHMAAVARLLDDPRVDALAVGPAALFGESLAIARCIMTHPRYGPGAGNSYALRWAIDRDDMPLVEQLLADPRVDPAAESNAALIVAADVFSCDYLVRLLADPRVDPAARDNWALCAAVKSCRFDKLTALLGDPRIDLLRKSSAGKDAVDSVFALPAPPAKATVGHPAGPRRAAAGGARAGDIYREHGDSDNESFSSDGGDDDDNDDNDDESAGGGVGEVGEHRHAAPAVAAVNAEAKTTADEQLPPGSAVAMLRFRLAAPRVDKARLGLLSYAAQAERERFSAVCRLLLEPAVLHSRLPQREWRSTLRRALQWQRSELWDTDAGQALRAEAHNSRCAFRPAAAAARPWYIGRPKPDVRSLASLAWLRRRLVIVHRCRALEEDWD